MRPRKRTQAPFPGNPADPTGFHVFAHAFFEGMAVVGRTESSVRLYRFDLGAFTRWCAERGITKPCEVTRPIVERYQRHLYHYRKPNGEPLAFSSQQARLVVVRSFYRWLARRNLVLYNPAADIDLPRLRPRIPTDILTAEQAETILAMPNVADPVGLRDRAILETLYSTGMRRMELTRLLLWDIDRGRGTVLIRQGKGKKDRVIPIGERAVAWIDKYAADARMRLLVGPDDGALFLTKWGERFHPDKLTQVVRAHVLASGVGKKGSCHIFRHTMATVMLENGADIRFIQQMLGHESLETTQVYTRVAITKLKEIHTATHPSARLKRRAAKEKGGDAPAADVALRAELENALAAEALEESNA